MFDVFSKALSSIRPSPFIFIPITEKRCRREVARVGWSFSRARDLEQSQVLDLITSYGEIAEKEDVLGFKTLLMNSPTYRQASS